MSEHTTLPPPRRLRRSVSSRTLDGRGIAVSAGRTAVVVDGAAAEGLWAALEPVLRSGVAVPALLDRLPQAARPAAASLIEQLEEHHLLCAAGGAPTGPLAEHFERIADDPAAASAAVTRARVEATGTDPGLITELVQAFEGTGISVRATGTAGAGPQAAPGATVTLQDPAGTEQTILVLRAGGWRLVGPAPTSTATHAALLDWVERQATQPHPASSARDRIADRLAAAQAVLDVLALIAAGPGSAPVRYHVTSPDVVSELHQLEVLPDLGPADGSRLAAQDLLLEAQTGRGPDGAFLEGAQPLWLGPLSPWSGPVPADLPQLPVGLATAATGNTPVLETGLDTADARALCLERLAELTALDQGIDAGLVGVGRDLPTGAARAITRWALAERDWSDPVSGPAAATPTARRYWNALTLREAVPARVQTRRTSHPGRSDLALVEILDSSGTVLGTGLAPSAAQALEEALIPAVGTALTTSSGTAGTAPGTSVSTAAQPRLAATREALLDWARDTLLLSQPAGAHAWARWGLHPVQVQLGVERA